LLRLKATVAPCNSPIEVGIIGAIIQFVIFSTLCGRKIQELALGQLRALFLGNFS
jgi:hypothetical protein